MSTELSEVEKSVAEFDRVGAGLAMLKEQYGGVLFDVTTSDGMKEAKAARAAIREPRYEIERIRKAAKAPILALGKRLDSEAARITAELEKLESPIDTVIKDEESRKDRERQEKIEAEQRRVADIQARIEAIRCYPDGASLKPSAELQKMLDNAKAMVIDESFQEFQEPATAALRNTIHALAGIHYERVNHEAEQARIIAERAELERLRAEQAERDRIERERLAEEERKARAAREAEEKASREKLYAEQAELARQQKAEQDRIAAENKKLADERAAFEAEQAEARRKAEEAERARLAAEEAERNRLAEIERQRQEAAEAERKKTEAAEKLARKSKYPGEKLIIDVLAKHFGVTEAVVHSWLIELRKAA